MMTHKKLLAFVGFTVLLLAPVQTQAAKAVHAKKLASYKVDLTGDEKKEKVTLKGITFGKRTKYFKEFHLSVKSGSNDPYKATIAGGFKPNLYFMDLTNDKIDEILLEVPTGGSGGVYDYYAFRYADGKIAAMELPEPLVLYGTFKNNYKVSILVQETHESYTLDVRNKKKKYDKLGIFQRGKLVESSEPMISEYTYLQTRDEDRDGVSELVGIQSIFGTSVNDKLAQVYSTWKYLDNKWILKGVIVKRTK